MGRESEDCKKRLQRYTNTQRHGGHGAGMKSDVEIEIEIGGSVCVCEQPPEESKSVKSGRE